MKQSLLAGLPLVLFGVVVTATALTYPIGSPSRMGPGFMPLVCGILMTIIGSLISAIDRSGIEGLALGRLARPVLAVFAGLVAWTLTVQPLGLVPATFLLVILASYAQPQPRLRGSLVTGIALSAFGVAVFIVGLNIRLSAFGS